MLIKFIFYVLLFVVLCALTDSVGGGDFKASFQKKIYWVCAITYTVSSQLLHLGFFLSIMLSGISMVCYHKFFKNK